MQTLKERPRIVANTDQREPINITPEAKRELHYFLTQDMAGTGIGYSEFIRQSIRLWRELAAPDFSDR